MPRFARHPAAPRASADGSAYYIVRLKDAPAATYTGDVPGFAATSARLRGETTLDVKAAASYAAYLDERQSALLDSGAQLLGRALQARFRYHFAFNGMSLKLTPVEAQRLAKLPGVLSMQPVRFYRPSVTITTGGGVFVFSSPASAGETNASRSWVNSAVIWQRPSTGTDNEGEGMVLADLDTGINHANVEFAATGTGDGYVAQDPLGVRFGVCDTGNAAQHSLSTPVTCNDKLIGAYSYTHGTGNDPDSPEDSEGHGSHTASTVAGDFVQVGVNGNTTPISGVAPHASIIAYDICDPTDLCGGDQAVAAVEQAIQDQASLKSKWHSAFKGMVLNYSIGGSNDSPYDDPVEMAFLSAVEAGIYVSAAAGNGGPVNMSTGDATSIYQVQHLSPWVATMAAATHDGTFTTNDVANFGFGAVASRPAPGTAMVGAGDSSPTPSGGALILYAGSGDYDGDEQVKSQSTDAPTSGEPYPASQGAAENARQCLFPFKAGTFPSGNVSPSETIVVCDRGTIPLVDKAYNVMKGGAGGVIIATTTSSSQDMPIEPYVIPGTLIGLTDGDKLRTWLMASRGMTPEASAAIGGSRLTTDDALADQVAGFSSRGPNGNRFDSVVKPDLTAPGVSVLAAVGDPAYADGCSGGCSSAPQSFDFFDGTSMASPHDAGVAALLKQAHPTWTPSEIKSALMLTAVTATNGSSPGLSDQCAKLDSKQNCVASANLPSPQVRGAGRIDADAADRSGLLLDETGAHYAAADPAKGGDLSTLNLASLGDAACAPTCSWTRTVTSAFSSATANYSVSVSGLTSGLQLKVSPASFRLAPGQSQKLSISADSGAVPTDHWAFGEVDITTADTGDGGAVIPAMHMPLAVQATVPSAHMSIHGALDYTIQAGASATQQFVISNDGQKPLSWNLTANGGAGSAGFSCSSHGMTGLGFDAIGGTVAADSTTTVTATFKTAGLPGGDYSGVVCVSSNASDNPLQQIPVSAKVTGGSGGGGGGGDESLFGLVALALGFLRRKIS